MWLDRRELRRLKRRRNDGRWIVPVDWSGQPLRIASLGPLWKRGRVVLNNRNKSELRIGLIRSRQLNQAWRLRGGREASIDGPSH